MKTTPQTPFEMLREATKRAAIGQNHAPSPSFDPIEKAIRAAHRNYVPGLCSNVEHISQLLIALAIAGTQVYEEFGKDTTSSFHQVFLKHAQEYQEIIRRSDFRAFKVDLENAWFSPSIHSQMIACLPATQKAGYIASLVFDWQAQTKADIDDVLSHIAIQKVAIAAAGAYEGKEAYFIVDDFYSTLPEMENSSSEVFLNLIEEAVFHNKDNPLYMKGS